MSSGWGSVYSLDWALLSVQSPVPWPSECHSQPCSGSSPTRSHWSSASPISLPSTRHFPTVCSPVARSVRRFLASSWHSKLSNWPVIVCRPGLSTRYAALFARPPSICSSTGGSQSSCRDSWTQVFWALLPFSSFPLTVFGWEPPSLTAWNSVSRVNSRVRESCSSARLFLHDLCPLGWAAFHTPCEIYPVVFMPHKASLRAGLSLGAPWAHVRRKITAREPPRGSLKCSGVRCF